MKNVLFISLMCLALVLVMAGCKDRVIWDDNGKLKGGDRKTWENKEGEEVVK